MKRRTLLTGAVAALVTTPAAAVCSLPVPIADPMLEYLAEHRAASDAWYALPPKVRDQTGYPSLGEGIEIWPVPTTADGAKAALRAVMAELSDMLMDDDPACALTASVLRYLEARGDQ